MDGNTGENRVVRGRRRRSKRDGVEGRLKYRIRDEERYWGCVMYS